MKGTMMSDAEGLTLINQLKQDLRKDPKDWESWFHLAEALEKHSPHGWEEEAAASYEKVMELAPDVAAGYLGFADLLINQFHDYEPAEAVLMRACDMVPDDIMPFMSLGVLRLNHLGKDNESFQAFSKASAIEPFNNDIRLMKVMVAVQAINRPEWVLEDVEKLLKEIPEDVMLIPLAATAIADVTGDLERAREVFEGGVKIADQDHNFWHLYGLFALYHDGDEEAAKSHLQRALLLDDSCESIYDDLAYLHAFMGDMATAWNYAQKALMAGDPDDSEGALLIADLNMLSGKLDGVAAALEDALKDDPDERIYLASYASYLEMSGASSDEIKRVKAVIRKNLPAWDDVDDFIARTFNPLA